MERWLKILGLCIIIIIAAIFCSFLIFKSYNNHAFTWAKHYRQKLREKYQEKLPDVPKPPFKLPIYYINLDRSPDRRENMESQLREFNLKATRIKAIDGKNNQGNIQQGIMDGVHYQNDFPKMTFGEIACTLSHLKAINQAYQDKHKYAIIMEDDVSFEFIPFWPTHIIQKLVEQASPSTGIIQLSWFGGNGKCDYRKTFKCQSLKLGTYCWSTVSYIITRKGMVDILMRNSLIPQNKINGNITRSIGIHGHPISHGAADVFLYQLTPTETCGLPLFVSDTFKFDTTIENMNFLTIDDEYYKHRYYYQIIQSYYNLYQTSSKF